MRTARWLALIGSLGLAASVVAAAPAAAHTARTTHPAPAAAAQRLLAQARSHPDGGVAASSSVRFDLVLSLRNATGAQALAREVSTPGSAQFHHYLTDAQWEARYGPAKAEVSRAASAELGMLPHSISTFGTVVRFSPARSFRKM